MYNLNANDKFWIKHILELETGAHKLYWVVGVWWKGAVGFLSTKYHGEEKGRGAIVAPCWVETICYVTTISQSEKAPR